MTVSDLIGNHNVMAEIRQTTVVISTDRVYASKVIRNEKESPGKKDLAVGEKILVSLRP